MKSKIANNQKNIIARMINYYNTNMHKCNSDMTKILLRYFKTYLV